MAVIINQSGLKQRTLYSVKEVPQLAEFAWLTESSLRHLIFQSENRYASNGQIIIGNGMLQAGVIKRFGKRILIDIEKLRLWVDSNHTSTEPLEIK